MQVRFEPSGKTIDVETGTTILSACQQAGLCVHTCCEGELFLCGFCRVKVLEGLEALDPPTREERQTLGVLHAGPDERLACQSRVRGDVTVTADYWNSP